MKLFRVGQVEISSSEQIFPNYFELGILFKSITQHTHISNDFIYSYFTFILDNTLGSVYFLFNINKFKYCKW